MRRIVCAVAPVMLLFLLASLSVANSADAAFGIASFDGAVSNADGSVFTQAGGHPSSASTVFSLNPQLDGSGAELAAPDGSLQNGTVALPAGLVGNPSVAPRCSNAEFGRVTANNAADCLDNSVVGFARTQFFVFGFLNSIVSPVYNLTPTRGSVAEFRFVVVNVRVRLRASVRTGGDYGVDISSINTNQGLDVIENEVTLWGVPADPAHDPFRGACLTETGESSGECAAQSPLEGFVRTPTDCATGPVKTTLSATSWLEPGATPQEASFISHDTSEPPVPVGPSGCDVLPFSPTIAAQPTVTSADSPTGLAVDLHMPQDGLENPAGVSESDLRDAIVTLPEGMSVNPSSANGLQACSKAQIDLEGSGPATCPDASKLGSVEIGTPLLDHPITGGVYLARQGENKFGSLLAIYLAVNDPETGVVIKLPGRVETTASGRVTARFTENPQLPFEDLKVEFFGGPGASLRTPEACGNYTTTGEFIPWSGTAPVNSSSSFQITSGPNGSPCPNGSFDPHFEAGTTNPAGGASSPFTLRVSRGDGTQQLSTISTTLPKGLLASLKGIPYCPDSSLSAIPTAEGTGAGQLANPSCPAASQVGTVAVGAGAGSNPFYVNTGKAYLAGPYKDAPLSLAIVTPALAGPFDLGNVVVRTALRVDPETTQVTADSDPLPTILDGIPLDIRDVRVNIDRADFTRNPTSCAEQQITSTIGGAGGAEAHPSSRFQVGSCEALPYKPKLALKLKGKTKRAGHPALTATLTFPKGINANTARAQVGLPHSEFLDQGNIGTVCTRPQLAAHACPAKSVYGRATAVTPLLDQPLVGPVYLGTGYGTKLPMLVAELDGQIGTVLLRGKIDTDPQGGIRATFAQVPDAPISKFTLSMQGGPKKGLIENSTDLCRKRQKAVLAFGAQNGKRLNQKVPLGVSCKGKKKTKGKKR